MLEHIAALLILSPLLAAFAVSGLAWIRASYCLPVALAGLVGSVLASLTALHRVVIEGALSYRMASWPPPVGIELRVDLLNSLVLVAVSAVALVNLAASWELIKRELADRKESFLALYLLFVTGLLGVTATADLFNLYVLLEITSLSAYALIAMGPSRRAPLASLNYVYLGVIGASFYLLGVGYLYIMTGSLNMGDIASLLPQIWSSQTVLVGFIFCLIGVWIKMAFFPMHIWLPNAYTYASMTASRVLAPLMTKVMVYVMIRLMLTVFGAEYVFRILDLGPIIVWLAILAIVAGAVMALAQRNLAKMLCYIIVSEIGYMVGGAWLGNPAAMTGTILHVINDALMTFAVFLAAGNFAFKLGELRLEKLRDAFARMPFSAAGFVLAGMSIVGVPPTCGFFSKWYLISGGLQAGHYAYVCALLLSSLINAVLFIRVIEQAYFGDLRAGHGHHGGHGHGMEMDEAPSVMVACLLLAVVGLVLVGLYSGSIVDTMIQPFVLRSLI
jgi:multicomponent Na+:H+ antiporter subunit D